MSTKETVVKWHCIQQTAAAGTSVDSHLKFGSLSSMTITVGGDKNSLSYIFASCKHQKMINILPAWLKNGFGLDSYQTILAKVV